MAKPKISPPLERTLAYFQGVLATVVGIGIPLSAATEQEWTTGDLVGTSILGFLIMTIAMRPWAEPED